MKLSPLEQMLFGTMHLTPKQYMAACVFALALGFLMHRIPFMLKQRREKELLKQRDARMARFRG